MKSDVEEKRLSISRVVGRIFGIIMVVLYLTLGTTIIFKASDQHFISEQYAVIFGIILILYGFFRAFKVYRDYFSRHSG